MKSGVQIPAPVLPRLYPKQHQAIMSPARYTCIEATTKAGKTAGCLVWILMQAWNTGAENRNFWWVAPIRAQAEIAFRRLKRMLKEFDPAKVSWGTNETDLRIDLRNGASIWFKGSDNPDTLYGEDVYAAVMDEASRCKEEAWHAVRSTLTATGGPVKIIGNVRGRKNWAYVLARKAESGSPDMAYFKLTAYDAVAGGIVAATEIADAKDKLPPDVFRELYLAEPSDDGGNPFGLAAIERCTDFELAPGPAVAFGADLAKSVDFTVACGLNAACRVSTLDRWQSDWGATRTRLLGLIGRTAAEIDSTGVGDPIVEDLSKASVGTQGFKFTSGSKQQLMEGLAAAINLGEVRFPAGWLVNELEAFEYEYTRTGVRYAAPEGLHDDGVCALALAVHCFKGLASRPRITPVSSSAFAISQ